MFEKIDSIIKEKNLTPSDCTYHTLRNLDNNGKLRILVVKGENQAHVEYICPKCGHYEHVRQEWKRPFSVKCSKCGHTIKVSKLKGKK
jgi:predicted RNA-binding Zn-ribbon protein involved in translation (DUF1610 family)